MQPETFDDTMADAETEILVNTQADTLANVATHKSNVDAEAQVNTLAERLLNVETRQ